MERLIFNSTNNLTTATTNVITGSGGLQKSGTGMLTLNASSPAYTGIVAINANGGSIVMGAANALGTTSTTTAITIGNGGALDIGGYCLGARAITAQGAGPTGAANAGAIINTGAENQGAISSFTMQAATTVGGTGRFDFSTAFNGGGFDLTKAGTNTVVIKSTGATNLGNVIINSGTLIIQDTSTLTGDVSKNVTVNNTGTLGFWSLTTPFVRQIVANSGSAIQGGGATNTVNSPIAITGIVTLQPSTTLVLAGNITGSGTLTKNNGAGTLVLTGMGNAWSNGTNIQGGTIEIGDGGANGRLPVRDYQLIRLLTLFQPHRLPTPDFASTARQFDSTTPLQ